MRIRREGRPGSRFGVATPSVQGLPDLCIMAARGVRPIARTKGTREAGVNSPIATWRVLIVDDHPIVRTGLAALIDAEPDMAVCGQADAYESALAAMVDLQPDVALIDLSLRGASGLELVKEAGRHGIQTIVVSMHEAPTWAQRSLAAGARGYVQKSDAGRTVVNAIRRVRARRIYLSEAMAQVLLERRHGPHHEEAGFQVEALSDREVEVLTRIGNGMTTQQIAHELEISAKTVQTFRERIKRKLDLGSAAELSSAATRWVLERED